MQVTKVMKEKAVELGKKVKTNVLYVNKNSEFFTSENAASLSVSGKKDNYAKIDLTAKVTVPTDVPANKDDENQK
jgi:hypothetical protein